MTFVLTVKKVLGLSPGQLPSQPYRYTHDDAKKIYDLVLSGKLTHRSGHETTLLEKEFSEYSGTKYSVSTNSGTSALILAMKAIGIKPGDEVIVPAYTFIAVAQAVLVCGGTPVFADINNTFTISPDSVKTVVTTRTRAIIVAHMFGNVAEMGKILSLARKQKLFVIEDCAQAIGAKYKGKRVGSIGDIGCFSFNEKKALPTGQGGMITTSNRVFLRNIVASRNTGIETVDHQTDVTTFGYTMFMTEMEASLARSILPQVDLLNQKRRKNFSNLVKRLSDVGDLIFPYRIVDGAEPSFSRFACMVHFSHLTLTRDEFFKTIQAQGIPVKAFYPIPLYRYSLFQKRKDVLSGNTFPFSANRNVTYASLRLPFAERFFREQVGMEFSPYLSSGDIAYIVKTIKASIDNHRKS